MKEHDLSDWRGSLEIARLAPNTGMVPLKSSTLLAAEAELEMLRAELACWRTKGRGLRLSDPEMADTVARLKHRLKTDKDFARSLLNEAGIVGKDGKLSPNYRA